MSKLTDFLPAAMPKATQEQAEAGTADDVMMTPLRTAQAAKRGQPNGTAALGSDGKVPEDQLAVLGIGQSWQTTSRTAGTSYQNTTGRPIAVVLIMQRSSSGQGSALQISVSLDNSNFSVTAHGYVNAYTWQGTCILSIVPNGYFYKYYAPSDAIFKELR